MNKKAIILIALAILIVVPMVSAEWTQDLNSNITSYWKLNETSGDAIDFSGTNNGTNTGVTQGVDGIIGTAYSYDGSGDYTDMGDSASLSIEYNQSFSTSFWVNFTETSNKVIFGKQSSLSHNADGWVIMIASGKVFLQMNAGGSFQADELQVNAEQTINDGNLHHVVITYNGNQSASGVRFYINGTEESKNVDSDTLSSSIDNSVPFRFGALSGGGSGFKGHLDEVGIWDRVLSSSEVSQLYNGGSGITYTEGFILSNFLSPSTGGQVKPVNVTVNSSLADQKQLVNVSLYINGTINSTQTISGTNNITTFNIPFDFQAYDLIAETCNNESNCANSSQVTINVKKVIESKNSFSVNALEQTSQTFLQNFTVSSGLTPLTGTLTYNNTEYTGSVTSVNSTTYQLSTTLTTPAIPSDINKTFYWTIGLNDSSNHNSTIRNQTVIQLGIDDCSANSIRILNFTLVDEKSQTTLNAADTNSTIRIDVDLFPTKTSTVPVSEFSQLYNETIPAEVCISDSLSAGTYFMDTTVEYGADGYDTEFYNIQKYSLNGSSGSWQNITLYDIKSSQSQEFIVSYKDESFLAVPDALIQVQRYYVDEGNFKTVELPKTDVDGEVAAHLVLDDVIYSFTVTQDGEVLATFSNVYAVCQNPSLDDCVIELNSFSSEIDVVDYSTVNDFSFTLTYDDVSRLISSTFSIPSGAVSTIILNVTSTDALATSVCTDTVTTASGTVSCTVPNSFGNQTVIADLYKDGSLIATGQINLAQNPADIYGASLAVLGLVLMLTLIGVGISDNPIFTIGFMILGVVLLYALNLVDYTGYIGAGSTILWLFIAFILIMVKSSRRT